jgi:hypothetical protein
MCESTELDFFNQELRIPRVLSPIPVSPWQVLSSTMSPQNMDAAIRLIHGRVRELKSSIMKNADFLERAYC